MRIRIESKRLRTISWGVAITLCLLAAVTATRAGRTPATSSIAVTNSSTLEIRHLYLSPTTEENWGPDQLDGATIAPKKRRAWVSPQVRLFLYKAYAEKLRKFSGCLRNVPLEQIIDSLFLQ